MFKFILPPESINTKTKKYAQLKVIVAMSDIIMFGDIPNK